MPLVSIVIPTKNRIKSLETALQSVLMQEMDDHEVIVVNDGGHSVDESISLWKSKLRLKLIELEESGGPARARNIGVENAAGEFVAFLDDDDIYLPSHLKTAVEVLRKSQFDLVYSGALVSPSLVTSYPSSDADCIKINNQFNAGFLSVACYFPVPSVVCKHPGKLGRYFDEDLIVCEDWEYWLRLQKEQFFRFGRLPAIGTVIHRIPDPSSATFNSTMATAGLQKFVDAWRKVVTKYPAETSLVSTYREYMTRYHDQSMDKLKSGFPLATNNYEHFTEHLLENFRNGQMIDNLDQTIERIITAV
jgi:glycosyltransferase involved in cell wall biosynthesis